MAGAIVGVIIWIICLVLNIKIARERGKSVALWVVLSVFFSWIALIINALTGRDNDRRRY